MDGMLEVDEELVYLATDMHIYEVAQEVDGVTAVFEGYVDLDYRADRSLIVEQQLEDRDPELVADRFVSIATDGVVEAANGEEIDVPADSICITKRRRDSRGDSRPTRGPRHQTRVASGRRQLLVNRPSRTEPISRSTATRRRVRGRRSSSCVRSRGIPRPPEAVDGRGSWWEHPRRSTRKVHVSAGDDFVAVGPVTITFENIES